MTLSTYHEILSNSPSALFNEPHWKYFCPSFLYTSLPTRTNFSFQQWKPFSILPFEKRSFQIQSHFREIDYSGVTNGEHRLWRVCYLVGGPSAGPARGFPGLLLGDAVDVVASPCGQVRVLLPQVHNLKRLLTWGGARRLQLRQTLLWLHFSVKRGVLPGQLGQIRLCRDLVGKSKEVERGKEVDVG